MALNDDIESYSWSGTTKRPHEYLKDFEGPEMIKMTFDNDPLDLGPLLDLSKPFVLYSHRRRTKVYADVVHLDSKTKKFLKIGPLMEIPKDYIGWFEVMPHGVTQSSFLTSLADVRATGSECFLTRTALHGFRVVEYQRISNSDDVELGEEHQLLPGEVLKITRTCRRQWKTKGPAGETNVAETKFLECVDFHGAKLVVPMAHPGQFNIVANTYDQSKKCAVYQIVDLIGAIKMPAIINLVFGWMPRIADTNLFKGFLRIKECKKPNSYILYQNINDRAMLTEIPFDADFGIRTADNREIAKNSEHFKKALSFCRNKVYPFAINIKALEQTYRLQKTENNTEPFKTAIMPKPIDMKAFRRSDVYPPLETQMVAEFWSITFKDPDSVLGTIVLETPGESTDSDRGRPSPMSTIRRQARLRVREQYGLSEAENKTEVLQQTKPRRVRELAMREATC